MKAFLAATAIAIVLAVVSSFVLDGTFQQSARDTFATEGVRLTN